MHPPPVPHAPGSPSIPASPATQAVLFADIAGSTKLYDTLGDTLAKAMIDECIAQLRELVGQYGGRVIKTIGDEIMCVLPDADRACLAATDMQLRINALPTLSGAKRAIRVGFHAGALIEEDNDVFGDTVNLAARMAGLAKAMQIMTTRATVQQLSPMLRATCRPIAALSVKGKGEDVEVCEVIWQGGDELTMATPATATKARQISLHLRYGQTALALEQANAGIVLGRDASCQIAVADRMASRQHARIERRQDKFFLIDQSTNGTFVAFAGEAEITLRREELMLRGVGRIAFGRSVAQAQDEVIEFLLRDETSAT